MISQYAALLYIVVAVILILLSYRFAYLSVRKDRKGLKNSLSILFGCSAFACVVAGVWDNCFSVKDIVIGIILLCGLLPLILEVK